MPGKIRSLRPGTRRSLLAASIGAFISSGFFIAAIAESDGGSSSWIAIAYMAVLTLAYLAVGLLAAAKRHTLPAEDGLYFLRLATLLLTLVVCLVVVLLAVFYLAPFALLLTVGRPNAPRKAGESG